MKLIPMSGPAGKGLFIKVDDEDFDEMSKFIWYLDAHGYPVSSHYGRTVKVHRLVMGAIPGGMWVDHKDTNPLNCQKANLRFCTPAQNSHNTPRRIYPNTNQHHYKGVYFSKDAERKNKPRKWHVVIVHNGKHLSFGYFLTAEEGARKYDEEIIKLRGEWAYLNFPK